MRLDEPRRLRRCALRMTVTLGLLTTAIGGGARADGCYICTSGSGAACKDYCRYTGSDTFDSRKVCEKKGCKIGGTSSCPTAANYKVCQAQRQQAAPLALQCRQN